VVSVSDFYSQLYEAEILDEKDAENFQYYLEQIDSGVTDAQLSVYFFAHRIPTYRVLYDYYKQHEKEIVGSAISKMTELCRRLPKFSLADSYK
jgi:hypothetical protein